jgi:hypothetical protein
MMLGSDRLGEFRHVRKGGVRMRRIGMFFTLGVLAVSAQSVSHSQMAPDHPYAAVYSSYEQRTGDMLGRAQKQALRESIRRINVDRQRKMADDSVKLLRLATDLNDSVGRSTSIPEAAMLQVDEIAKLAHDVREKMRSGIGD